MAHLTDTCIFLRPLRQDDAREHLAGEDDELAKWLSGGSSSLQTVETYITSCQESWRTNGPRRAFGIFDCATGQLIGSIEANLAYPLAPGQVNVSYGVFFDWRGKGIALRALSLMRLYLKTSTGMRQMILRIACENGASLRVAEKAKFQVLGVFDEAEGRMTHYSVVFDTCLPIFGHSDSPALGKA